MPAYSRHCLGAHALTHHTEEARRIFQTDDILKRTGKFAQQRS